MNSRQAKDFLVQQVTKQAAFEREPLSDLETRMMYFTESDPSSCADPFTLNDEFEAQYDESEYEGKISGLLQRAYEGLDDQKQKDFWGDAVSELRKGDHYLLVLLDEQPHASVLARTVWDGLRKLIGIKRGSS
jgi:hypothetical protein